MRNVTNIQLTPKEQVGIKISDEEDRKQMIYCRDKMLEKVNSQIEKYRIENMKKLSKEQYDDIIDPLHDGTDKVKISRCHSFLLKLQQFSSVRNWLVVFVVLLFVAVTVIPNLWYLITTFDKYYFGYIVERSPRLGLTTTQKKYFMEKNIPFKTIDQLDDEKFEVRRREASGLPMPWVNETEMNYGSYDRLKDGISYIKAKSYHAISKIKKPQLGPRAKRWL